VPLRRAQRPLAIRGCVQSLFGPAGLQPPVVVKTTGTYTVTANDNLTTFDNSGAGSNVDYTLPNPPVQGMTYTFLNSATTGTGVRLTPGSGVSIQLTANGCSVMPAAGITVSTTTQYSGVTLQAINSPPGVPLRAPARG